MSLGPFGRGGTVTGHVAPGWESVRLAFEDNFCLNLELGAQCVIYHKGTKVVDLHGRSSKVPSYTADTLQCIWSCGKNLGATAIAVLADRGLLRYDDLVTKHWPEFGQHGKGEVTIADVMRHEAGVPFFSGPSDVTDATLDVALSMSQVAPVEEVDKAIENSGSFKNPDLLRCYHAMSREWLVSGIVRRVDPGGRSLGRFINDEIAQPLGVAVFSGMPPERRREHQIVDVAQMPLSFNLAFNVVPAMMGLGDKALRFYLKAMQDKSLPIHRACVDFIPKPATPAYANDPRVQGLEIPSATSLGNARAIARINACLCNGGELDGVRLMSRGAADAALAECVSRFDACLLTTTSFSQGGFADLNVMEGEGVNPSTREAFRDYVGWAGWGGSISVWNPKTGVAVGYVMTGMGNSAIGGPRTDRLLTAVKECLANGCD